MTVTTCTICHSMYNTVTICIILLLYVLCTYRGHVCHHTLSALPPESILVSDRLICISLVHRKFWICVSSCTRCEDMLCVWTFPHMHSLVPSITFLTTTMLHHWLVVCVMGGHQENFLSDCITSDSKQGWVLYNCTKILPRGVLEETFCQY